ncbi:hypothetical protein BOTCAL_0023g00190 [Botryotinia calthae]|uniref:Uncharacterized protein n=1 Tax=Botryotinia calthae TaxID=38488 RepID=A0A4Y8DEP6_9HELO|nr:hypothetical protein BOTCAL_0023g00190 [Botryotinia calthae]
MSSPLSSPGSSPGSAAGFARGDSESIESPVFNSSNRATSSFDSDQTLTNTDPASDSSPAQSPDAKAINAENTINERVPSETTAAQEAMAAQSPNETNKRNYSDVFKPEQYNAHKLKVYHVMKEEKGTWSKIGEKKKARVPYSDAQHTQPKEVRDKAIDEDRDGTSRSIGIYMEKERKILHDGVEVEDSTPIHYMSQFIEDHHTPIPEHERKRKRLPKTYTFKTYFPSSAFVQCAPHFISGGSQLDVKYIETVLETKSKESFELKARIKEDIECRKRKRAEAAEAVRLAKAAKGFTVAPKKDLRVGLECHMLADNGFPLYDQ